MTRYLDTTPPRTRHCPIWQIKQRRARSAARRASARATRPRCSTRSRLPASRSSSSASTATATAARSKMIEVKAGDDCRRHARTARSRSPEAVWDQRRARPLDQSASPTPSRRLVYDFLSRHALRLGKQRRRLWRLHLRCRRTDDHARLQRALHRVRLFAACVLRRRRWDIVIITRSLR